MHPTGMLSCLTREFESNETFSYSNCTTFYELVATPRDVFMGVSRGVCPGRVYTHTHAQTQKHTPWTQRELPPDPEGDNPHT